MGIQVFPEHVTQKLKHGEAVISEAHDCVTVRFPVLTFAQMDFAVLFALLKLSFARSTFVSYFPSLQVLFSDIVGYTSMSTSVNTADVFDMLNKLYTAFDALSDKHGVYKVDTIGDGQPSPAPTISSPCLSTAPLGIYSFNHYHSAPFHPDMCVE